MLIKNQRRIFYGWFIVAVSFLCWFAADAFGWYTFGIFLGPITREFGWTITLFTGAFTLRMCIGGLLGPVVGPLVDKKYGARILMSMGVLIAGTVPILVSRMQALWQFYALYGVISALSMVGFGGLVTNAVIGSIRGPWGSCGSEPRAGRRGRPDGSHSRLLGSDRAARLLRLDAGGARLFL